MRIRISSEDKRKLERQIEAKVLSQKDKFWAYQIAKELIPESELYSKYGNRTKIYVGQVIKSLEAQGKIKLVEKNVQGYGPMLKQVYKVV